MTKLLIAVTDYPNNDGGRNLFYVHVRSLYYKKENIQFDILNFNTDKNYKFEGVNVISLDQFKKNINANNEEYKLLICHAPNIRKHYLFLNKYGSVFKNNITFFFHGHEILKISNHYPKPYKFNFKARAVYNIEKMYDIFKIKLWKRLFKKNKEKFHFIFVSKFLKQICLEDFRVSDDFFSSSSIIPNSVGEDFQQFNYELIEKKFDFITIRNHYDSSTYAVDLIKKIAEENPNYSFCLIGKGHFFKVNPQPKNLHIINDDMSHSEILKILNNCSYALMPTRHDSQGVMSCECATYGIPLITSDIEVCNEVFDGFKNVKLIPNKELENLDIKKTILPRQAESKNKKYFNENTVDKEVLFFKEKLKKGTI